MKIVELSEEQLPRAAAFAASEMARHMDRRLSEAEILGYFRWRLLENPQGQDAPLGFALVAEDGEMLGLVLNQALTFQGQNQCYSALAAGQFFLRSSQPLHAIALAKKFLRQDEADFCLANSCNASSAPIFERLQGRAVPSSQYEYLWPANLSALMRQWLEQKSPSSVQRGLGLLAARLGQSLFSVVKSLRSGTRIEEWKAADNWEELADLAKQYSQDSWLSPQRSAAYLRWNYAPHPQHARQLYTLRWEDGQPAWLALEPQSRGAHPQLRGWRLLDYVGPCLGPKQWWALCRKIHQLEPRAPDFIAIPGRVDFELDDWRCGLLRRRMPQPLAYLGVSTALPPESERSLLICAADQF